MRPLPLLIASVFLPASLIIAAPPAFGQSAALEQACVDVAKNFLLAPSLKTGIVQSFPELTPPGARLTYSTRENPEPTDFNEEAECTFKSTEQPLELTSFCLSGTCYSPAAEEPEERRRFEEVRALMSRR